MMLKPFPRTALFAALLLAPLWQYAAAEPTIHAPQSVPVGGLCIVRVEGLAADASFSWLAVPEVETADLMQRDGTPVLFVGTSKPGVYSLVLAYLEEGKVAQKVATVVVGQPAPVPPTPEPDPPVPTPSGQRTVLLIRETADTTPEMARMITALRNGENAAYIAQKGHRLSILDDDSVDANGQPTPVLASWRPHFASMTLPVVFIIDTASGQLVHKQEVPSTATAADVMAILRGHGG